MSHSKTNPLTSSIFTSVSQAFDGAVSRMVQGVNANACLASTEVDRLREVREKTISLLGQVNAEQALWSPRSGTWSIAQIADHLLRTEEMYREQFRRVVQMARQGSGSTLEISLREVDVGFAKVPRGVIPALELPLKMFNLFVPHVVRETMVRYPVLAALNPRSSEPRGGLNVAKLKKDLVAALEETERFFRTPLPVNIDRLAVNHPVIGNNTVPQLLSIMIAHEQRHQEQMSAVLAHANFPKASREPVSAAMLADMFGKHGG